MISIFAHVPSNQRKTKYCRSVVEGETKLNLEHKIGVTKTPMMPCLPTPTPILTPLKDHQLNLYHNVKANMVAIVNKGY